jgi:hypothetical protein
VIPCSCDRAAAKSAEKNYSKMSSTAKKKAKNLFFILKDHVVVIDLKIVSKI